MSKKSIFIMPFGKHQGQPITRVPVCYLKWMVGKDHQYKDIAQAELDRRGTVTPEIEISGHAIDRASQKCLDLWQNTHKRNEGIHAWLVRMAKGALKNGTQDGDKFKYKNMAFVVALDNKWPVIKTVYRRKEARK